MSAGRRMGGKWMSSWEESVWESQSEARTGAYLE